MGRTKSLRQKAWEKCEGLCVLCGLPMLPDVEQDNPLAFTIEHMIPKSKEGANGIENLSGSHQWCNQFKSDMLIEDLPVGYRPILRWKIKHLLKNENIQEEGI